MKTLHAFLSKNYWKYLFSPLRALQSLLSAFGALWLIVEVSSFFSNEWAINIKSYWYIFFIIGIVCAVWQSRPILTIQQRLRGRDVIIEICIGDFFDCGGDYIISSNSSFDTDIHNCLITLKSIQGQFTQKFYKNTTHLDSDIAKALECACCIEENYDKKGKNNIYEIGTVARLSIDKRNIYFLAIANMSNSGTASTTYENLQNSLAKLWDYIGEHGDISPLVTSVLGTGLARLEMPREEIIKEIIKSFIAANSSKRFTERLTIVIHPSDYSKYDINIKELNEFLKLQCRYAHFKSNKEPGGGVGLAC